ncbi:uncharacterized protein LOC122644850 [Telopea speciosissima]|uniref:uncharacterized protein LOC122644850 n=1 Tax=Telopea speciosissima TaxID=54955 RepID=UPI001CC7063E|nr:uncharacterized protein LOC122644850 [Telopea speciosissima]
MLNEMFGRNAAERIDDGGTGVHIEGESIAMKKYERLMEDANLPLYPGNERFTKLSFILRLYHIKCLCKLSNKAFSLLLDLLKEAFLEPNSLPKSLYKTKKIIKDLGLNYEKIDACRNDCMLYWNEAANATSCYKCGISRYISDDKKIPVKILRHFPLIPRFQRLYISSKLSSDMRWHHEERVDDQKLRHPADAKAWKDFDRLYLDFSEDPRNIRLGLASDGFNPFKMNSSKHNLHAYKKETFKLRACLLWTINDFLAYGNLSGWSTKCALACPCCNKDTVSRWLKYGRKHCYLGHRRFLPPDHKFHSDRRSFDGHEGHRVQPKTLSGFDVLEQLWGAQFPPFGKDNIDKDGRKRKRGLQKPELPFNWKKKSIFFDLPYWKNNVVHHNLDVMHIEKNVCDSIIGTLLGMKDKTKDHVNPLLDLKDMKIRVDLHPKIIEGRDKVILPPAYYILSNEDKEVFCTILSGVKVPDGYGSNISRNVQVKERIISGMKSHDCHIMMHQLLPVSLRSVLPKNVGKVLIEICEFFRDLCSKVGLEEVFKRLNQSVVVSMCNLERYFPPGFFDVMVHLIVHLANEASLAGPVHYRWMYPIERFLKQLKDHVRNNSRPEGSIAEGYIVEEC